MVRLNHEIISRFLLTRPYGRDQRTDTTRSRCGRFYSHAHTGVIR